MFFNSINPCVVAKEEGFCRGSHPSSKNKFFRESFSRLFCPFLKRDMCLGTKNPFVLLCNFEASVVLLFFLFQTMVFFSPFAFFSFLFFSFLFFSFLFFSFLFFSFLFFSFLFFSFLFFSFLFFSFLFFSFVLPLTFLFFFFFSFLLFFLLFLPLLTSFWI